MDIDWSKAPDWAVAHGLHETGFGIKEFWLGEAQHQNLEHAKSFPYGGGDPSCGSFHNSRRESFSYVTPRPDPWTGVGLPPVGTVCDWQSSTQHEWKRVTVIAYNGIDVWLHPVGIVGNPAGFRPIRTPEQIAAEEREKAAEQLYMTMHPRSDSDIFAALFESEKERYRAAIDAGYRKQVAP